MPNHTIFILQYFQRKTSESSSFVIPPLTPNYSIYYPHINILIYDPFYSAIKLKIVH